ncbi:hypothetical protein KC357_g117 [Hortaea werneckii]|nr:hypothetical protein KC357_g117 [Hortaea werneckii]
MTLAPPDPINRPVPMVPPMAIICRWRLCSLRLSWTVVPTSGKALSASWDESCSSMTTATSGEEVEWRPRAASPAPVFSPSQGLTRDACKKKKKRAVRLENGRMMIRSKKRVGWRRTKLCQLTVRGSVLLVSCNLGKGRAGGSGRAVGGKA